MSDPIVEALRERYPDDELFGDDADKAYVASIVLRHIRDELWSDNMVTTPGDVFRYLDRRIEELKK